VPECPAVVVVRDYSDNNKLKVSLLNDYDAPYYSCGSFLMDECGEEYGQQPCETEGNMLVGPSGVDCLNNYGYDLNILELCDRNIYEVDYFAPDDPRYDPYDPYKLHVRYVNKFDPYNAIDAPFEYPDEPCNSLLCQDAIYGKREVEKKRDEQNCFMLYNFHTFVYFYACIIFRADGVNSNSGSGSNPSPGSNSGPNPSPGSNSGYNPGSGSGTGPNPSPGSNSGFNYNSGSGSGPNPSPGSNSGFNPGSLAGSASNRGEHVK